MMGLSRRDIDVGGRSILPMCCSPTVQHARISAYYLGTTLHRLLMSSTVPTETWVIFAMGVVSALDTAGEERKAAC